jgi:hypothetical protein
MNKKILSLLLIFSVICSFVLFAKEDKQPLNDEAGQVVDVEETIKDEVVEQELISGQDETETLEEEEGIQEIQPEDEDVNFSDWDDFLSDMEELEAEEEAAGGVELSLSEKISLVSEYFKIRLGQHLKDNKEWYWVGLSTLGVAVGGYLTYHFGFKDKS